LTLKETLYQAKAALAQYEDARVEAELLMMDVLGLKRAELYLQLEEQLTETEKEDFWHLIRRRMNHEPVAYILNHCQFYGMDFYMDSRALIPRPESELLVEETLKIAGKRRSIENICQIVDVGTGCGAIAVALAKSLGNVEIYATDISEHALEVAQINCRKHQVGDNIRLLLGNLLEPVLKKIDIIVANLPYVRNVEMYKLSPEIRMFEPAVALRGGIDGLDRIRQLLPQAKQKLMPGGALLLEIGQGQAGVVLTLIDGYFKAARITVVPDLAAIDRVVKVET
jgi:release factor glutamine methyltransferase